MDQNSGEIKSLGMKKNKNHQWPLTGARYIYLLAGLVFLTGAGLLFWFGLQYFSARIGANAIVNFTNTEKKKEDCQFRRVLDGSCVKTANEINPRLVSVMVDNHPDALPQSGLDKASIVYEAPVEGSFTRFMALFPVDASVGKVGPIRSARPYHLDWLQEFGRPVYMHVGGSPEALDLVKQKNILDYNEFYNGAYYWRDLKRTAPHNIFTGSRQWQKIWDNNSARSVVNYSGWLFSTSSDYYFSSSEQNGEKIILAFNSKYTVEWRYVSSTKQYERFQYGGVHLMENNAKIFADTVVVQETSMKVIDEEGRRKINTLDGGKAVVYLEGSAIVGAWNKIDGKTRFYVGGNEIKLKPGKIWVEVISN